MERNFLIATEFHFHPGDMWVYEFMQYSEKAAAIRDERRKAAENGMTYQG
jgi:hypothetical protein